MRVPYPKVELVRRKRPGQLSKGDFAIASTTTALIDFVDELAEVGIEDARSYSLRHILPLQLGATSCDALLAPTLVFPGEGWAAFRFDVCWCQLPSRNENLRTLAEAESMTPARTRFSFTATSGNVTCATGVAQYVRLREGVNLSTGMKIASTNDPPASPSALALPNSIDHRYSPFLVQLLMNSICGGHEPLGRRLHPLGAVPWGAAVSQAMQILPERHLASATMKYIAPIVTGTAFVTSTALDSEGRVVVSFASDSGTPFAVCVLKPYANRR